MDALYLQPIDTMPRISREDFCDCLDIILEISRTENIGWVITNEGEEDVIMCPAAWFRFSEQEQAILAGGVQTDG